MRRMKCWVVAAVALMLAGPVGSAKAQSDYPEPPGADHRRLRPGLIDRHHRASDGQPVEPPARPAIRGREPARRSVGHRRRSGGAVSEGRPHVADRRHREPEHRPDQPTAVVRHRAGLHAGHPDRRPADDPHGASFDRRFERERIDRARQIQARNIVVWLHRRRRLAASPDRAVPGADRHQDGRMCPTRAARRR